MSAAALWIVTSLYGWQMVTCVLHGQFGNSLIMAGYIIANLGLIISMGTA